MWIQIYIGLHPSVCSNCGHLWPTYHYFPSSSQVRSEPSCLLYLILFWWHNSARIIFIFIAAYVILCLIILSLLESLHCSVCNLCNFPLIVVLYFLNLNTFFYPPRLEFTIPLRGIFGQKLFSNFSPLVWGSVTWPCHLPCLWPLGLHLPGLPWNSL